MYNILFIDRASVFVMLCFVFVVMRFTVLRCFRLCSWCLWKALDDENGLGSMTFGLVVQKFLTIE